MVSQFRPDWQFYSSCLDTLEMYLSRHCLTYNIEQRLECIQPNTGRFQRVLRSLGILFGDRYVCITCTSIGTGCHMHGYTRGVCTQPQAKWGSHGTNRSPTLTCQSAGACSVKHTLLHAQNQSCSEVVQCSMGKFCQSTLDLNSFLIISPSGTFSPC